MGTATPGTSGREVRAEAMAGRDNGQWRPGSMPPDESDTAVIATDLAGLVTAWNPGAEQLHGWTAAEAVGVPILRLLGQEQATQQIRAISDSVGDGLCTLDHDGLVTYVNPPGLRMLRTSLETVRGAAVLDWLHLGDAGRARSAARSPAHSARTVSARLVRADDTELPVEYVATPLAASDAVRASGWVVVFRDLSDRVAREDELALQVEQVAWLTRIRGALDHDGFVLDAQPIVDLRTGRTMQHELLLRMRDPDRPGALILPSEFLPTAEALGVAPAIDRWVLARGFEFAAHGHPVEMNLSATSLEDATLPHLIEALLYESGADPGDIVFEITETALLENDVTARYFADRMRQIGCRLALDDFGTGYGGFTYLKHYPLDYLKIDIEFVRDAVTSSASRHVIESVISLARAFGLRTIAEGVEDEATLQLLRDLDVDLAQGYLFGRPVPAAPVFPPGERHHP